MRVCRVVAACVLAVLCGNCLIRAQESERPTLLLTSQRLRRLRRDRDRQTVRWLNFEKRIETVPDSPERGFELALYYAVTGDQERAKEAVTWAAHSCDRRQVAIVTDWLGDQAGKIPKIGPDNCVVLGTGRPPGLEIGYRDSLFSQIATTGHIDTKLTDRASKQLIDDLESQRLSEPTGLYAAFEYLIVLRDMLHVDLRQENPSLFSQLPKRLLLSLRPEAVEHPDWMLHAAALAYIAFDPNSENSQFLQGWVLEDSQMLREGPGVAYEFLWADPYLPGIAYQNMDPWIYTPGALFARASWDANACWLHLSAGGRDEQNCSSKDSGTVRFGTLTLSKADKCTDLRPQKHNEATILWGFRPDAQLTFESAGGKAATAADHTGMWLVPVEATGKVCVNKHDRL